MLPDAARMMIQMSSWDASPVLTGEVVMFPSPFSVSPYVVVVFEADGVVTVVLLVVVVLPDVGTDGVDVGVGVTVGVGVSDLFTSTV